MKSQIEYYYLDGVNKIGPLTQEEIINLHLSENTWVYCEGMKNWKMISEVEELQNKPMIEKASSDEQESDKSIQTDNINTKAIRVKPNCMKTILLFFKALCSIAMIVLCIYNLVLANKLIGSIAEYLQRGNFNHGKGQLVLGVAILLSSTIIAFAIFVKSVINSNNHKI